MPQAGKAGRADANVAGIGDMTIGAQTWIFRPPTESNGNIAFSVSLKIPTGVDNATGAALLHGQPVVATADQSLQPGDGGWGFVLASQAYKQIWLRTMLYFQGQYLFNPEDTNGVATFRTQPGQAVMSITDQYLFRGGFSHGIPHFRRLELSLGGRFEGVPVRDAFGSSDGFRRPGYIVSIDPGMMFSFYHERPVGLVARPGKQRSRNCGGYEWRRILRQLHGHRHDVAHLLDGQI